MDKDVLMNKLESLRRCVQRVQVKAPVSSDLLKGDYDLQDIIVLNLERAVQTCVDIGLHIISDLEIPVPDTMAETFKSLNKAGYLDDLATDQEMDWEIVYRIITEHLDDFRDFSRQIMKAIK